MEKPLFGPRGQLFERVLCLLIKWEPKPILGAVKSIFVLRSNDLGDVLVTTPLFRALRQRFPQARISVGVGEWAQPLLRENPFIDETIVLNAPWANKFVANQSALAAFCFALFSPEVREIAKKRFDVGIDVFGSQMGALLLWRAGIRYRIGVRGRHGGWSASHWAHGFDRREHVSVANLCVAQHLKEGLLPEPKPEMFLTEEEKAWGERRWMELGGARGDFLRVILGPCSGDPSKNWPEEHFRELATRLSNPGVARIIVVGGPKDRQVGARIVEGCIQATSLAGDLELRETAALVASADLVVCNSSMLLHTASAFRRPTLVVLGPNFYASAADHEALWGYPDLGPTLAGKTPDSVASVEEVYQAAVKVLEGLPRTCAIR